MNVEKIKKHLTLKNIVGFGVILFFFIFATIPFKHGGLFRTTDDIQVVRTDVLRKELLSLQFPVRYAQELGNGGGYFIFNFYPPLTYYLGFIFLEIGISLVKTIKILFLLGFLFGGLGFYFLAKKYTDKISAIVASVLFFTSSYLAFDVYFRGALPEVLGFTILPWLLLFFFETKLKPNLFNLSLASIFYGLTMLFHTTMGVGIFPILLLLFITPPYSKKSAIYLFGAIFLGLCISSFYLLPSVVEQAYTQYKNSYFVTNSYLGNFINPLQAAGILKIPWSFEPPIVGLGIYLGVIMSVYFFLIKKYKKVQRNFFIFLFGGFLISTFLAWDLSRPFWENVTYLRYFQFPYRFLAISTTCGILMVALGLNSIKNIKIKILLGIIFILPAITLQYSYLRPTKFEYVAIYTADDGCSTTTWTQEYLPLWTKQCLPKKNKIPTVQSSNKLEVIGSVVQGKNGRNINFNVKGNGGKITVKRYYFPGWEVFLDNKFFESYPSGKYGLITFKAPSGNHKISVILSNTFVRNAGNIISLIGILVAVLLLFFPKKNLKFLKN